MKKMITKKAKKGLIQRPWFIILIIISTLITIVALSLIIIGFIDFINSEKEKNKILSTKYIFSDDYNFFDNSMEDLTSALKYYLEKKDVGIANDTVCNSSTKKTFNSKECHEIELDNQDKLYVLGDTKKKTTNIVYNGVTNDFNYLGKIMGVVIELYSSDFSIEEVNDIDNNFLELKNLNRMLGLGYVFRHIQFDYIRPYNDQRYTLIIKPTKIENQEEYKLTDSYISNRNAVYKNDAEDLISKYTSKEHEIESYDLNPDTGLVDIKIKYNKSELSRYVCALDTQYLAKKIVGSENIGSIQFECINNYGTFYYVKVDNINSISVDEVDANTKYYNTDLVQEDMNINTLQVLATTDYKNTCSSYGYKDVLRYPENYKGNRSVWFGEVLQVVSKTSTSAIYRIGVSCTPYQYIGGYSCPDTIYVTYDGDGSFIEDDMVNVYGTIEGTQTYTTVLGASVTVPKISAKYIDMQ